MNTLLVWILFNVGTSQPAVPYYFANQSDCLRAGMVLENNPKTRGYFSCEKMNIADPYIPHQPAPADAVRARRNYQYEQQQIDKLLNNH